MSPTHRELSAARGRVAASKSALSGAAVVARNSVLNAGTSVALIALGLVFVPLMIRSFGMELYGVLTVTWMLLGQLGWLNAGLGRASTRFVARDLALGEPERAGMWTWTAAGVQFLVGSAGAALLWALAPLLVGLLSVQPENEALVVFALRAFGLVVPLELASSSVRGVLEATQRFGTINGLSVLEAAWTYAVYALGIALGGDLGVVVLGLAAFKVLNLGLLCALAVRALPALGRLRGLGEGYGARLRELLGFGGWVAVSQGAGPLLLFWDRWVVSSLLGAAALPLYTVPFGLLQRLGFLPASLASTLFPAFTDLHARQDWSRVEDYFVRAHKYLLLLLLPALVFLFVWGHDVLRLWVGAAFAAQAGLPLQLIAVGFGVALLAPLSNALLEGAGRPDVIPKVYLVELPLNLALVYLLTVRFGIVGAAASFMVRALLETAAIWILAYRALPLSAGRVFTECVRPLIGAVAIIGAGGGLAAAWGGAGGLAVFALTLVAYAAFAARVALDARDVEALRGLLRRRAAV